MRALLQRLYQNLLEWLGRPVSCEDCGEPEATFRPNQEAYLCRRCAGEVR